MARALRVEFAGGCYHVINRGNYRQDLFRSRGAAEAFERMPGEAAERFGWRIHAYVVMRNHFHLAVEIAEPDLGEGMKWLQGTWVRRFNGYRHLVGRPFQGRYKALLVEPGQALGQVGHYIHLNPVRAGVVRAAKTSASNDALRWRTCPNPNRPWHRRLWTRAAMGDLIARPQSATPPTASRYARRCPRR
jgi:REP element-mobilizing transposase RayT